MREMTDRAANTIAAESQSSWPLKIGGAAALIAAMLLLVNQDNWLIKIFKLHSGFSGIDASILHGLNIIDISIIVLVGVLSLCLGTAFKGAGRIWAIVASALSLIATFLFIVTSITGRSTVMLAVLIISLLLMRRKYFGKLLAISGILASIFLFVGDLTVGVHSNTITIIFGAGYVLLIVWLFLIGMKLLRLR